MVELREYYYRLVEPVCVVSCYLVAVVDGNFAVVYVVVVVVVGIDRPK